jgi:hypothetical protein
MIKTFIRGLKKRWVLVLLFFLTLFSCYSLIRAGFFPMQDDLQAFRVHQMLRCLEDFQLPCRWVPDMGYQFGYPQFNFYGPSVFYLGAIFHLLGLQIIDSVKLLFILGFVVSAGSMYLFLKDFLGRVPALVGATLFLFAPFRAVQVYVRGSLNEFWAVAIFPLLFWASYNLIKKKNKVYSVFLALSLALLLITHNLMAMIFLPILGVWIVSLLILEKDRSMIPQLLGSVVLGIILASFYILPMVGERQFVHVESMLGGYFDYRQHFVNLQQLFFSNYFGYGSSVLGPNDDLSLSVGIVQWLAALSGVILALVGLRKRSPVSVLVLILGVMELGVVFLMHQKSSFIWERLNLLVWLQFPWRFLADSTFLLSVMGAAAVFLIKDKKLMTIAAGIIIAGVVVFEASFFQPKAWFDLSDQQKFSGNLWEKQLTISIFDYLPNYAVLPPNKKAPEVPEVMDGQAEVKNYQKGSNFQKGEITVSQPASIRLPLFDFPGMEVKVDGQNVPHRHDDCRGEEYCLGLISFNLPEGQHQIEARLTDTPVRSMGNALSLIGLAALLLYVKKYAKNIN